MKNKYILLVLTAFLLASCGSIKQKGESEIMDDATPPVDYNPVFITKSKNFNQDSITKPAFQISSIDSRQPNAIKAKFHITDNYDTFLSGATQEEIDNLICFAVDSTEHGENPITSYKIREIQDNDGESMAIAAVLDHSGSMGEWRANAVQSAISDFITSKRDIDLLSIIKYDGKVQLEVPLTKDKNELDKLFLKNGLTGYGGMTAICNSIQTALNVLDSANYYQSKAVIVFTDGYDNSSNIPPDTVIAKARATNTIISAVDFGENINPDYMKKIAEATGGTYHHIYKTEEFSKVFEDLYFRLNNYYVMEFNTKTYGKHKIKIKLCFPKDTLYSEALFDNTPNIGAICLLNIFFDFDKATIQKESEDALESVVRLMNYYPDMRIEVRGHTDSLNGTKDPDYNLKLSQKRADAVKNALVKKGISVTRISSVGYGEKQAISDNQTEKGRAKNRRTEFVIISR